MTVAATQWTDVVTALGAGATAIAAAAGLGFAWAQVRGVRAAADAERLRQRQELSYRYFQRLMSPEMIPFIGEWRALAILRWRESPQRKWKKWRKRSHTARLRSLVLPNFFEELASMYFRGVLDQEVVDQFLGAAARGFFDEGRWFVELYRRTGSPAAWDQWQKLCEGLQDAEEAEGP